MGGVRSAFHDDLEKLRSQTMRLGASVTDAIPRATAILLSGDLEGADYMVQADDEVDVRTSEIEAHCFELLALQSPVAGELRETIAVLKMAADLERSGDLAVNICRAARRIYGHEIDPVLRGLIPKLSEQAQQLFVATMDAFEQRDFAKAAAIDDMDAYLDGLHRQFIQAIFECHKREKIELQVAVQLAVVARFYERIGDHAVNVSERTRFMINGWTREQDAVSRFRSRGDGAGEIAVASKND